MTAKELSPKQARWVEELARFDFEIEYKPGQDNPANGPSRRPDYAKGILVGEQQAERDAMLPTLQQKLRIWAIRKSMATSTDDQAVRDQQLPRAGPAGARRSPETADSLGKEFPDQMSVQDDASLSHLSPPATVNDDEAEDSNAVAGERLQEITKGLLRDLTLRVSSPNSLAVQATQDESAYALEVPDLLSDYIREPVFFARSW
jgi:hypothetical protein